LVANTQGFAATITPLLSMRMDRKAIVVVS